MLIKVVRKWHQCMAQRCERSAKVLALSSLGSGTSLLERGRTLLYSGVAFSERQ